MSQSPQVAVYFAGIVIGQGLGFITLPLATRLLSTAQYGDYALLLTVGGFLGVMSSAPIRNIGFRQYFEHRKEGRSRELAVTVAVAQAVAFTLLFSCAAVAAWAVDRPLADAPTVLAALLFGVVTDLFGFAGMLLRAEDRPVPYAAGDVMFGTLRCAGLALALQVGWASTAAVFVVGTVACSVAAVPVLVALRPRVAGHMRFRLNILHGLRPFIVASMPIGLGGWGIAVADRFIIGGFLGRSAVGLYSASYQLGERVMTGIGTAVQYSAWPAALHAWSDGSRERTRAALVRGQTTFFWLSSPAVVAFAAWPRSIVTFLFGAQYVEAADVLPTVAIALWVVQYTGFVCRPLELERRYGAMSWVTVVAAAINVALTVPLVAEFGVIGAAVATLAAYGVVLVLYLPITDRGLVPLPWASVLGSLVLAAASATFADVVDSRIAVRCSAMALAYFCPIAVVLHVRRGRRVGERARSGAPSG